MYCKKCGEKNKNKRKCKNCGADLTDYEKYANDGFFWGLVSPFIFIMFKGLSMWTSIWGLVKCIIGLKSDKEKIKAQIGLGLTIFLIIINIFFIIIQLNSNTFGY